MKTRYVILAIVVALFLLDQFGTMLQTGSLLDFLLSL